MFSDVTNVIDSAASAQTKPPIILEKSKLHKHSIPSSDTLTWKSDAAIVTTMLRQFVTGMGFAL